MRGGSTQVYVLPWDRGGEELTHAQQSALARRVLDLALRRTCGVALSALTLETGPRGKPFFADHPARFSLSHCPGLVCCALGGGEVGVDAEVIRPLRESLRRRVCTPEELSWLAAQPDPDSAFIRLWTLKEALVKFTGEGIAYGMRQAAFQFAGEEAIPSLPGLRCASYAMPGRAWVSLCCRDEPPARPILLDPDELPNP